MEPTPQDSVTGASRDLSRDLRKGVLSFSEVIAQSFANIAPTNAAALTIPFVFASAGAASWLTFVVATVGLIFVGLCVSAFARRGNTSGALYTYTSEGLGRRAGFLTGWAMLMAYLTTGMAVVAGFAHFSDQLLGSAGVHLPAAVYYLVVVALVWTLAYRDVRLSARTMLYIEAIYAALLLVLAGIVLVKSGVDWSQFRLSGLSGDGLRLGLVLAVFAFVGFESSAALGSEARDGVRSVPRALLLSTLLAGAFFVFITAVEVSGFKSAGLDLGKSTVPLIDLARAYGVPAFGVLSALGTICACFACALACVNASSRLLFNLARDGFLPARVGDAHAQHATPHLGVHLSSALLLLAPLVMTLGGIKPFDSYGLLGTVSTYGFLWGYIVVCVAAVVYLGRLGQRRAADWLYAALGVAFMLVPVYGSVVPFPAAPYNLLPPLFGLYMLAGLGWSVYARRPALTPTSP